ncbi:MAG: hypothetical protein ACXWAT_00940 [Methylobacter sp.]
MTALLNDLYHYFGSDLAGSATADLQTVNGSTRGQQRILRRLLTNPREVLPSGEVLPPDYIFHPEYGAGLPRKVGDVFDRAKITALIRSQILLEESVAKSPEPQITINEIHNGITCTISYVDAISNAPAVLSFNVNQ